MYRNRLLVAADRGAGDLRAQRSASSMFIPPMAERDKFSLLESSCTFDDCCLLVERCDVVNVLDELARCRILNILGQVAHSCDCFIN